MLNLHLYFVKIFGCYILDAGISIDLTPFANAILKNKACPYVYLNFGRNQPVNGIRMTGMSHIEIAMRESDRSCAFATWFYFIGELAVNVMYAVDGEKRDGLIGAWHPRLGTNKLILADFG